MLNERGRISVSFYELRRQRTEFLDLTPKPKAKNRASPFYSGSDSNRLMVRISMFDDQYADEHHVMLSAVLHLRVGAQVD